MSSSTVCLFYFSLKLCQDSTKALIRSVGRDTLYTERTVIADALMMGFYVYFEAILPFSLVVALVTAVTYLLHVV